MYHCATHKLFSLLNKSSEILQSLSVECSELATVNGKRGLGKRWTWKQYRSKWLHRQLQYTEQMQGKRRASNKL